MGAQGTELPRQQFRGDDRQGQREIQRLRQMRIPLLPFNCPARDARASSQQPAVMVFLPLLGFFRFIMLRISTAAHQFSIMF
jgi:hypothetical protein